jgi:hypothetical protein
VPGEKTNKIFAEYDKNRRSGKMSSSLGSAEIEAFLGSAGKPSGGVIFERKRRIPVSNKVS